MLHLSELDMLSAGGPGAACALTTSWGIDSATGGTSLVKGRGPGSELATSMSGGDCFGTSAVRRRCQRFLRYNLLSSLITWYECTPTCLSTVAWVH